MKKAVNIIVSTIIAMTLLLIPGAVFADDSEGGYTFSLKCSNISTDKADSYIVTDGELPQGGTFEGFPCKINATAENIENGEGAYLFIYINDYFAAFNDNHGLDGTLALYEKDPEMKIESIIINGKSYNVLRPVYADDSDIHNLVRGNEQEESLEVEGINGGLPDDDLPAATIYTNGSDFQLAFYNIALDRDTEIELVFAGDPDAKAANELKEKLSSLDVDELTISDETMVKNLQNEYAALSDKAKALITEGEVAKINAAANKIESLKAIDVAVSLINSIGEVTLDDASKEKVDAARKAYDALSAEQKKAIDPAIVKVLTNAEQKLIDLQNDADEKAEKEKIKREIAAAKALKVKKLAVTCKSRKFTVKWAKTKNVSGYQVQYRIKGKKWNTLKKSTTANKVVSKKLKKGKQYVFRVRTIKKINGKKYYGKWATSKAKKCK